MGGSDNDNNYSKRVQFFVKYNVFVEKPHMISKRAFFSSQYTATDNAIYVFGGSDSNTTDLDVCEKFSLLENVWRPIASMKQAKNGLSSVCFEAYRLIFVFGGNSHASGSLNQIEKYEVDFDKWTLTDLKMTKPIHDMCILQISRDKVMIFGGHTDVSGDPSQKGGPNREVQLVDLTTECFKARFGSEKLYLNESSTGGKTYFPP